MKRLSHIDWAGLSSALPAIYSQRTVFDLACVWMKVARDLISADMLMTGELSTPKFEVTRPLVYPYRTDVVKLAPMFLELAGKIPEFVPGYAEGSLFGPLTSRMPQRRFEGTDLFNAFHRPLGLRYQFAGMVPDLNGPHMGFVVHRYAGDYTVRDEEILRHLSQHYSAAIKNVRAFAEVSGQNVSLDQANQVAGQGIVFLTPDHRLESMSPLAATQLAKYCGGWRNRASMPENVSRWMREQLKKIVEGRLVGSPMQPLKLSCGEQQLTIRLILHPINPAMLVLTESTAMITVEAFKRFGLTPRETEVLYWLVHGKTDREIALLLGTREGTTRKHVERILAHFGTQNRTATVAHVLEQLRAS
ncbi:MAG: response regulator transcription factor [Limisphaerales bacterium]